MPDSSKNRLEALKKIVNLTGEDSVSAASDVKYNENLSKDNEIKDLLNETKMKLNDLYKKYLISRQSSTDNFAATKLELIKIRNHLKKILSEK